LDRPETGMPRRQRYWRWYGLLAATAFAALTTYVYWRLQSCTPVQFAVHLDRDGTYRAYSRSFARERYFLSFDALDTASTSAEWHDETQSIWSGQPPRVEIEIRDSDGALVLSEKGPISRANGWTASSSANQLIDIYKFSEFVGAPFKQYAVSFTVAKPSAGGSGRSLKFQVRRLCNYEGLAYIFWYVALGVALLPGAVIGLFVARRPNSA
jgi:hypothetical protein